MVKEKDVKNTNKQKRNTRYEKALKLRKKMVDIEKEHIKKINEFEKLEKTQEYKNNRLKYDKSFELQERNFDKKERKAYTNYYNHIHKDFDVNKINISYKDPKYKDGFVDKKYIKDLYKSKAGKNND